MIMLINVMLLQMLPDLITLMSFPLHMTSHHTLIFPCFHHLELLLLIMFPMQVPPQFQSIIIM